MKKLLTLAAAAAIVAASALPAAAATGTGNVTVQWNISVTAALTLNTNYGGTGTLTASSGTVPVGEFLQGSLGSSEACAAPASVAAGTVDFGSITPDGGLAANTVCAVKQAVNAKVSTNSINWSLGENMNVASAPTGIAICALSNSGNFPISVSGAAANVPTSGRTAASLTDGNATGTGTCAGAGELTVPWSVASNNTNMATSTTAYPTGTNIGEDLELITAPSASTGAQTKTLTVTLLAN
ncbi:MAG TPA: hypothetical protein VFL13_11170 [Candidatus Baltobacteraceae bacterium]|nr:hypothetical protein [Candidatus Baltobacteraceae bacterium]